MIGPVLKALLESRSPNRCYCGRKRKVHQQRDGSVVVDDTCARKECLDRWRSAYGKDYRAWRSGQMPKLADLTDAQRARLGRPKVAR